MAVVFLPPRLFPNAGYYQAMVCADRIVVDAGTRYDKRSKAVHRYDIIDARGPLQLTVPLGKPHGTEGRATWRDALVSTHDEWWRRHRTALESAYGRTPYFEFLIDKFDNIFRSPQEWSSWPSAIDLIREANSVVTSILAIDAPIVYSNESIHSHTPYSEFSQPYWQVREHIFGFRAGLSILDLIFNLGPEAAMFLRR